MGPYGSKIFASVSFYTSKRKIAICHSNCSCQEECQDTWASCYFQFLGYCFVMFQSYHSLRLYLRLYKPLLLS